MAELSLETRCFAFGCHPQAAQFTGFLINHSDICASPLPAGLPTSCWSLRSGNTFAQAYSSEKLGMKVWWLKHNGNEAFLFYFQVPPRLNMRLNSNWLYCVFTIWYIFTFQANVFTVCDCSVANFSGFPWERALFTSPLLAFSSVDFYSTCYPEGSINNI